MDWASILGPAAGIIGAAVTVILRIRNTSAPSLKSAKSRLRQELEILRMLKDAGHSGQDVVTRRVDALIEEAYAQPRVRRGGVGWLGIKAFLMRLRGPRQRILFVMGVVALVGFSFWSWYLVRVDFTWWVVGTGFGALMGIGWIAISYEELTPPDKKA